MNKVIAYYSLVITSFTVYFYIFNVYGDTDYLIGGIMFIPVVYSIWQNIKELNEKEKIEKIKADIRLEEKIRKEVKKENE